MFSEPNMSSLPEQDKTVLFGYQSQLSLGQWPSCSLAPPPILRLLSSKGGRSKGVWPCTEDTGLSDCQLSNDQVCGWDSHKLAASILIGRWELCLEVFGKAFMDTVGEESIHLLSSVSDTQFLPQYQHHYYHLYLNIIIANCN